MSKIPLVLASISLLVIAHVDATSLAGQVGKLYPADEAPEDLAFKAFRERLIDAVRNQDTTYVLSILDPNIKNSLGGDGGIEEFKERWFSTRYRRDLWTELLTVLEMGGHFHDSNLYGRTFVAPYVSSSSVSFDPYRYAPIISERAEVRGRPVPDADVVTYLAYDIVPVLDWRPEQVVQAGGGGSPWVAIELADGTRGFVRRTDIRRVTDYRAVFVLKNGRWYMRAFLAGD